MYDIHGACSIVLTEVIAVWSELHSDPKLDKSCYLVRVMFRQNPTILTVASEEEKESADKLVKKIKKDLHAALRGY